MAKFEKYDIIYCKIKVTERGKRYKMNLTPIEIERYSRQMIVPQVGAEGQKKLKSSSVLVIGAGGLGSPAVYYLAGCGIGTLGIADGDKVSLSNLHRQILHSSGNLGLSKALSAKRRAEGLNPEIDIKIYDKYLDDKDIVEVIRKYDFIVDATDRYENKFLINDACIIADKPLVHAGILRTGGQIMTIIPHKTPCLRCIFEEIPDSGETCAQSGIIGMTCGIAGSIEAAEAVKYLIGAGELLTGKILTFDCFTMKFRCVSVGNVSERCTACSGKGSIDLSWYSKGCG